MGVCHTFFEALYNPQLCQGRIMVENSFGISKKMFKELLLKTNLHIVFLLDVVVCCCMVHNLILDGKDEDIKSLLFQLDSKNQP
jgi:hypothetical protein